MTNIRKGVLEHRAGAIVAFILFSCLSAWSWASITSSHHLDRDPVYLGGLLFAIFITVSVAFRSPLAVDRIAFGAAACAFLFAGVATVKPLGPDAILVVRGAKSLMWTLAAVVGLVVLVRGSKSMHGRG
ncbi:MAG TPA: hypothetical protein VFI95_05535 [Terriglobales bacterium]|nr:hypothetical protein [Terriglobales bacterium]